MNQRTLTNRQGFTLIEIIFAMAISLIILSGVYNIFISQQKSYKIEDQVAEMMQNARVGLDFMIRDIRLAGSIPEESIVGDTPPTTDAVPSPPSPDLSGNLDGSADDIEESDADAITFEGDHDADSNTEMVRYSRDTANSELERETWEWDGGASSWGNSGNPDPVAENITALTFTYFNSNSAVTTTLADIRLIQISITARTDKEDPDFTTGLNITGTAADGTCRTRTLTASVRPRNLGL